MKLASIELVQEVQNHPNGDNLDIVKVLGYRCIVGRDQFKVGAAVVLIQPDTVLPDEPWAEMFKKRSNRVKAMKLRGEFSFGIVLSPYVVFKDSAALMFHLMPSQIGVDISERIGVTKYEAPVPQQLDALGPLPYGLGKTDEDRYQLLEDVLPYGEVVKVSLKVDGCLEGSTLIHVSKKDNEGEFELVRIDKLVEENSIGVKVLTFNTITNEVEVQPILSTSIKDNDNKQWYEVELDDGTTITITENHKVWLPDLECYRRVDELVEGDEVIVI